MTIDTTVQASATQTPPENPLVTAFRQQDASAIVPKALALAVNTNEEYDQAGQWLADLRDLRKKASDFFRESISTTDRAHKAALAVKASAVAEIDQAATHLNAQMTAHKKEVERVRAEHERKERAAEAHRERMAQIERDNVAAVARRALKEAEDVRIAAAEQAEATGNPELAETILEEEVPDPPVAPAPAPLPPPVPTGPPPPALPTSSAMKTRANWKARTIALRLLVGAITRGEVDIQAVQPAEAWLNVRAREFRREDMMYPGVECYNDEVNTR